VKDIRVVFAELLGRHTEPAVSDRDVPTVVMTRAEHALEAEAE
jgi:hypothetical protein